MADIGNLNFGVHLVDYTDAEADKIKKKLENLSVSLTIDGKNVSVSNPDSIKKQIEDAIKSVTVQSVKVDTASLANQIQNATSNITSQVKVSFLSGTLATDIQTYLDAKSFKVSISITKSQVQNEVNTAFANVSVPVTVKVSASAAIQQLQQSIANRSISVGLQPKNVQNFVNDIESKLKNKKIKVELEADKNFLVQSVKQALQGTAIKAQVDVNVDPSAITRAVQSAINNASFTYNPNGGRRNNANATANAQRNLGNSYRYAGNEASQSARASVTLGRAMATNIKIAGDLGTALGNLAAVFKVKDILEGVVTIGGQLENQRIALGAILQDGGKAVEMFSKIQSLAVKSPFGIMDLNQYTKQLAAYGIEYNELYDTMKRMADISAGVGVDMGRIILAFGQVRAAGFLKGTELRQFTEANIPMVEKLADRFTKLSGEIVTAGEVYDMISEKKISFEDVKAVLWDLTDEGGRFFNMQEVLAESLASKWKNLGDAIDVMLGKIAEGGTGDILKGLAEILTDLTKHWDKFALALGTTFSVMATRKAAITMLMYSLNSTKGALRAFKVELLDLKKTTKTQLAATSNEFKKFFIIIKAHLKSAKISFKAFYANISSMAKALGRTLRSVAVSFLPLAILTGIVETFYYFWNKSEESADRVKDLASAANDGFDNLSEKIKSLGDEAPKTAAAIASSIKKIETAIRDNVPNAGQIINEINKKDKNGKYENSEEERYKKLKKVLEDTQEAYKILGQEMSNVSETANKATDGFLDQSFRKNLIDASNAMTEYRSQLSMVSAQSNLYEHAVNKAAEADADFAKAIKGKNLKESLSLLKDHETALRVFEKEAGSAAFSTSASFVSSIRSLRSHIKTAEKDSDEFVKYYKSQLEALGVDLNNIDQPHKIAISIDITKFLNSIEGLDDETKKLFTERILEKEFNIKLSEKEKKEVETSATPYDESKDEVAKMWKRRAEEIEKAVKMYDQWKKVEGVVKAQSRVKGNEELASLFSGAYGFNLDLENPTKAYEYIQSKLNEKLSAQKKLKIELGVKISDAELKDAQDKLKSSLEQIKKETDKIVEGWNLYEDLFKATGNKQVSMEIAFGGNVSFKDKLSHLKSEIKEKMSELGVGISFEDLIKMDSKQLEAGGFSGLSGLIETYNKETTKVKEESVKNFIDIINRSKDFSEQIVDIERKLQKDLEDLNKNAEGYTPEQIAKKQSWLKKEAEQAKVKVQFEEFKESSNWVKVFDDLDRVSSDTLDTMISGLEKFAAQAHLSEDITKQLVEAMRKLREEAIDRNPFEGFKYAQADMKRLRDAVKGKVNGQTVYMVTQADGSIKQMSKQEYKDAKKEAGDTVTDSILAVADKFDAVAQAADFLGGMLDSLGIDMSGFLGTLSGVLTGTASGAKTGADISKKLGLGGAWGAAAGAAIGAITSISQAHDKKLDVAIEESKQKVKELGYAYENLEGIIEWQLGGVTDKQATEMLDNLNQQVYELYEQRRLEEEKKKTDPAKVADYTQQIHKAEEAVRDFYANWANEQYGVDIKNWASDIASALTDAFASGEDAAQAFDNTVGGILKSLATEAIRMQFIEPAMNNLRSFLFDSNSGIFAKNSLGGTQMTEIEAGRLAGELNKLKEQIGLSNEFWEKINDATGGLLEDAESAKGGLTKDIQGVTEDTANLLGSYLNAIRQSVHVKQQLIEKLVVDDIPKINYLSEAQLRELSQIQINTARNVALVGEIRDLVNRVVDKGSNKLKV
jgi:tape measure domain-containing protein